MVARSRVYPFDVQVLTSTSFAHSFVDIEMGKYFAGYIGTNLELGADKKLVLLTSNRKKISPKIHYQTSDFTN